MLLGQINNDYSYLLKQPANDPLKSLKDKILGFFGSGYVLLIRVGLIVSVLAFIGIGFYLLKARQNKKDEHKEKIYGLLIAMFVMFGAASIVALVINIALSLLKL